MTKQDLINLPLDQFSNTGFYKLGYRKDAFLKTWMLIGRERILYLPSDEIHRSVFAIVDLENIIASHNEITFASTTNYPTTESGRNINDRNYETNENAQAKVNKVANLLEPNVLISTSATEEGSPIITIDGVVISGNNRTMSMKLMDDIKYGEYASVLFKELAYGGYNIDRELLITQWKAGEVKRPVLVRFDLEFPAYITEEMNQFNQDTKKSERSIDSAIRISQQLRDNEECQQRLIRLVSQQEIVSEIFTKRESLKRLKTILLDCKLMNENEIAKYFKADGLLDTAGKNFFRMILTSLILDPNTLEIAYNEGVKSTTNRIINALIPMIQNKNLAKGNLNKYINLALVYANEIEQSGLTYDTYINQFKIEEDPDNTLTDKYIGLVILTSILEYSDIKPKSNGLKNQLVAYNEEVDKSKDQALAFFEPMEPSEVFEKYFVDKVKPSVIKALKLRYEPDLSVLNKSDKQKQKDPTNIQEMDKQTIVHLLETYRQIQQHSPTDEVAEQIEELEKALA
jgi:hypothetical protein